MWPPQPSCKAYGEVGRSCWRHRAPLCEAHPATSGHSLGPSSTLPASPIPHIPCLSFLLPSKSSSLRAGAAGAAGKKGTNRATIWLVDRPLLRTIEGPLRSSHSHPLWLHWAFPLFSLGSGTLTLLKPLTRRDWSSEAHGSLDGRLCGYQISSFFYFPCLNSTISSFLFPHYSNNVRTMKKIQKIQPS